MIFQDESFGIIPLKRESAGWSTLLVLHKSGHHWGFPKGHANEGELPIEAASRELTEETGLQVEKLLRAEPFIEEYKFRAQQKIIHKKVSFFAALVTGDLFLQEEEIREARWISLLDVESLLSFKEAKLLVAELMQLLVKTGDL